MQIFRMATLLVVAAVLLGAAPRVPLAAERSDHPRLWITSDDLPRLRGWARSSNPVYQDGLRALAATGAQRMDNGTLAAGDNAGSTYAEYTREDYATLFALMALIDPDLAARPAWAQRSRTLLMQVLDSVDACQRARPPVTSGRYCQLSFPISDRSRWSGHAFALSVDWLQAAQAADGGPVLSAADLATIRRVFLIWSRLSLEAYPNPYNNPPAFTLPVGTVGEPLLRQPEDTRRLRIRFAGNNYFAGHMRNMAMRALALDVDDDVPDPATPPTYLRRNTAGAEVEVPLDARPGALRELLRHSLEGWLYMQDHLLRVDSRGGLPQEGLEYAPTSIGIPTHLLLALETAGLADAEAQTRHGLQVAGLASNPFYRRMLEGFVHSQSPRRHATAYGLVSQPFWYGDGEQYYQNDAVDILAPIALYFARTGDHTRADLIRWVQRHVPPGGNAEFSERTRSDGNPGDLVSSILYFLLFDPDRAGSSAQAPDPRGGLPLSFYSEGLGRLLARTDWGSDATAVAFKFGYNMVDHQQGDAGMVDLYRRGEWLTRGTLGYGNDGGASDYKNTLTIGNTSSGAAPTSFLGNRLRRGAQMSQNRSQSDPVVYGRSEGAGYVYLGGDMTGAYNAYYPPGDPTPLADRADDTLLATRDMLWLKPDHIVLYDRAESRLAGSRKRAWINLPDRLPAVPQVSGNRVLSRTPGGQTLAVTALLPAAASLEIVTTDTIMARDVNGYALGNADPLVQVRQVAGGSEKYATRLAIEDPANPPALRFLNVLQGADSAAAVIPAASLRAEAQGACSTAFGVFEGAEIGQRAVFFPQQRGTAPQCLSLPSAAATTELLVVGMQPHGGYLLNRSVAGDRATWTIRRGGPWLADAAGVLAVRSGAAPAPAARLQRDRDELSFDFVVLGAARELSLGLHNVGNATLVAGTLALQGDDAFRIAGSDCGPAGRIDLAVGGRCTLTLRFAPSAVGYHAAALSLGDSAAPPVPLLGWGAAAAGVAVPEGRIFAHGFEGQP